MVDTTKITKPICTLKIHDTAPLKGNSENMFVDKMRCFFYHCVPSATMLTSDQSQQAHSPVNSAASYGQTEDFQFNMESSKKIPKTLNLSHFYKVLVDDWSYSPFPFLRHNVYPIYFLSKINLTKMWVVQTECIRNK